MRCVCVRLFNAPLAQSSTGPVEVGTSGAPKQPTQEKRFKCSVIVLIYLERFSSTLDNFLSAGLRTSTSSRNRSTSSSNGSSKNTCGVEPSCQAIPTHDVAQSPILRVGDAGFHWSVQQVGLTFGFGCHVRSSECDAKALRDRLHVFSTHRPKALL